MSDIVVGITATLDTLVENNETYTIAISNPSSTTGASVSGAVSVETTISDDDTAAITVEDVTIGEDGTMTFTATLNEDVQGGLSVDVDFTDVTASSSSVIAGYDFDDGTDTPTLAVTVVDSGVTASNYDTGAGLNTLINSNNGNSLADSLDAEGNEFGTDNQHSFGGAQNIFGFTDMANANNLGQAIDNNDYMTFTVTPDVGKEMDLSSFTFRTRANQVGNSAERWALFSSVDGFANGDQIATGRTTDAASWTGGTNNVVVDLSDPKFQNLDSATEFRIVNLRRE